MCSSGICSLDRGRRASASVRRSRGAAPWPERIPILDGDHIFVTPLFSYRFRFCLERHPAQLSCRPVSATSFRARGMRPFIFHTKPWDSEESRPPPSSRYWLGCTRRRASQSGMVRSHFRYSFIFLQILALFGRPATDLFLPGRPPSGSRSERSHRRAQSRQDHISE